MVITTSEVCESKEVLTYYSRKAATYPFNRSCFPLLLNRRGAVSAPLQCATD